MEEKKLAMAALEGAAQNHFDGTGAVMNPAVSFSEDEEDSDFDEGAEFIDGGECVSWKRLWNKKPCFVSWGGVLEVTQ